jgi:cytochrome c-type biogenesis protein CcmI
MTNFLLVGLAMALFAVGCIVVPMLRGPRTSGVGRASSNVAILRGELSELENDLARGTLDRAHYGRRARSSNGACSTRPVAATPSTPGPRASTPGWP